jgi:hypothetical protein
VTTVEPAVQDVHAALADAVRGLAAVAGRLGREDLATRLQVAVGRLVRPTTIVCVVGEFKQGKSSLVNAILGETICPVDDDLATSALTLVRHGDPRRADIRRRSGNEVVTETVEIDALGDWVSEAGNPANVKGVERVDVTLRNDLLARGIAIVDTPGMGSLGAGHAAATLAFLPFADALVFVSDASAELSAPEVEFLHRASELCPNVLFALTKTDVQAAWRTVAELDASHLATAGVDVPLIPLSSRLRSLAIERSDRALNDRSGFPALFSELGARVLAPVKELASRRAVDEATAAASQLESTLRSELEALGDSKRGEELAAAASEAVRRLEHLRGPGARWSVLVGDRITDLTNDSTFAFRGAMRHITRDLEARIERMKVASDWDDLSRELQTEVADAVTAAFVAIANGAQATREEVVELLAVDAATLEPLHATAVPIDVRSLWTAKRIEPKGSKGKEVLGDTLTGLRGAQSGIIMFGMMARFLPVGIGALLATNPVTIGLGIAFGGMQLKDAHKRKIGQLRQRARGNVRQFYEDVQFEIGNAMAEALRTEQRAIRDEFTERVTELLRTSADAARQADEASKRDRVDAEQRHVEVSARLAELLGVQATLATVGPKP